jgi:hypothetical protein
MTAAEVREGFARAEALMPWDTTGFDAWELENVDSIKARAIGDALAGRRACPIWGDNGV